MSNAKAGNTGAETKKASWPAQATEFFNESIEELKKVSAPTKQETIQATLVTILIMVVVAFSLLVLDFIFSKLMIALIA